MSLTVTANGESKIAPIEPGTYLAVCSMVIDLGMQYNETYKNSSRKVLIMWELPAETITIDGEERPRTISKQYTASLNERATLRQDLASWRGRDFTTDELEAFDLQNIAGASCYINIIRTERNGRTYSNISSIMALPRGVGKGTLSHPPLVFDLDASSVSDVDKLPKWIAEIIKKSETYQDKLVVPEGSKLVEDSDDDGELPF